MLTFEEKIDILDSFPELTKKEVSLGRVNYHYEESVIDKKNVVYHLHPNGNGFVYAGELKGYQTDEKGMVNIRNYSESELRSIVYEAIESLSPQEDPEEMTMEEWVNDNDQTLVVMKEGDMWNVYAGLDLDGTFNSYPEATDFLDKEGFTRAY
ncbi:hypothetical protein D7Z54_27585 [Salibacterium salarium]|uniref:Uncharacterized protein n=1 Tax=Salibacterium salarium TaxID=284579 RepID=A0A3R9QGQ9_9BACI|nr:hypothetical protein [Salibacterium salarium]RSL30145.1 hypothetical protein D7Z54_27585 [Salibacterium salarium]